MKFMADLPSISYFRKPYRYTGTFSYERYAITTISDSAPPRSEPPSYLYHHGGTLLGTLEWAREKITEAPHLLVGEVREVRELHIHVKGRPGNRSNLLRGLGLIPRDLGHFGRADIVLPFDPPRRIQAHVDWQRFSGQPLLLEDKVVRDVVGTITILERDAKDQRI